MLEEEAEAAAARSDRWREEKSHIKKRPASIPITKSTAGRWDWTKILRSIVTVYRPVAVAGE